MAGLDWFAQDRSEILMQGATDGDGHWDLGAQHAPGRCIAFWVRQRLAHCVVLRDPAEQRDYVVPTSADITIPGVDFDEPDEWLVDYNLANSAGLGRTVDGGRDQLRAALAIAALLLVFTGVLVLLGVDGSWYAPCPCSGAGGYPIWLAIARNAALIACCCLLMRWDRGL